MRAFAVLSLLAAVAMAAHPSGTGASPSGTGVGGGKPTDVPGAASSVSQNIFLGMGAAAVIAAAL